jgi:succinate dehydrogenase / fumarate reductase cytochrome b subunit
MSAMQLLPRSPVGKKVIMAITGLAMILFTVLHLLGNATIYSRSINAYAASLHSMPVLIWLVRSVLFTFLALHIITGIQLYLENRRAKPGDYIVGHRIRSTFAGRTMIWTGLLTGGFLVYHLLHFTIQITNPEISSSVNLDAEGKPDLLKMVIESFQQRIISLTYISAMVALLLHLMHGIQSSFQTLGLNDDQTLPVMIRAGYVAAGIIFLGYISIPVIILMSLMKG